jgi:predicted signal transduction protein with EAL and GGDEF domain
MLTVNEPGLRRALDEGQIVPYFQPLMELRTGRISGFEVLARWLHPDQGLISPAAYIPLAESSSQNGVVRREKALVNSGCKSRPGTGSLHPVAIEAAVEVTKPLEPSM